MKKCNLNQEQKDSLASFVLDALPQAEMQAIERHLAAGCQPCEQEVTELRETFAMLACGVPMNAPAADVRARLLARAAAEPQSKAPLKLIRPRPWYRQSLRMLGRIAASFIVLTLLATETVYLLEYKKQARQQAAVIGELKEQIKIKQSLISSMGTSRKLIIMEGNIVKASARAFWDTNHNTWLFYIEKLPPAPKGKTYQLWFITEDQVMSAGLFQTDSNGCAELPLTMQHKNYPIVGAAVSLEPEGGSVQPRGAIYLSGPV